MCLRQDSHDSQNRQDSQNKTAKTDKTAKTVVSIGAFLVFFYSFSYKGLLLLGCVFDKYLLTEFGAGSTQNDSHSKSLNLVKECEESYAPPIQCELSISTRSFF